MRVLRAGFLFALGAWGIPVAGIFSYAGFYLDPEGRGWAFWLGGLFWTLPAAFGIPAYVFTLAHRGGRPTSGFALLFGLAFSALPLLLIPIAWLTEGRLDPEECLWGMPIAAALLAAGAAWMTPLKAAEPA